MILSKTDIITLSLETWTEKEYFISLYIRILKVLNSLTQRHESSNGNGTAFYFRCGKKKKQTHTNTHIHIYICTWGICLWQPKTSRSFCWHTVKVRFTYDMNKYAMKYVQKIKISWKNHSNGIPFRNHFISSRWQRLELNEDHTIMSHIHEHIGCSSALMNMNLHSVVFSMLNIFHKASK